MEEKRWNMKPNPELFERMVAEASAIPDIYDRASIFSS